MTKAQNEDIKQVEVPVKLNFEDVVIPPKDEEEIDLEKLVFGDFDGFQNSLKVLGELAYESLEEDQESGNSDNDDMSHVQDDAIFFVDSNADGPQLPEDVEMNQGSDTETTSAEEDAWSDSDDEKMKINLLESSKIKKLRASYSESVINSKQYILRLRAQYEKIYPRPIWADEQDTESEASDDEPLTDEEEEESTETSFNPHDLLRLIESKVSYKHNSARRLVSPKIINISRLKDANFQHISKSAIQTLDFHQNLPLLITGGYDKTLRIYSIDGKNNSVVSTIHLTNYPIQVAKFYGENKVVLGGRRKYMYQLNLTNGSVDKISNFYGMSKTQKTFEQFQISRDGKHLGLIGNRGYVNVISLSSGLFIKSFKIDGVVADFVWSMEDKNILIMSTFGKVFEFDFHSGKIVTKWDDENGIGATKIAIAPNDKHIAIGSSNGIVNIYQRGNTKPIGVITSLVTTISSLKFNFDGQLLSIASRAKKDALRLVHLPSCSVYQNWPTSGTPLGKVTAVAFSPQSEMLCVGNLAGKARLFQLNDY